MSLSKIVWQTRKLGEVANIFNGNSINENEKKEKYLGLKSGTPYISTKDIEFDNKIDFENGVLIPKDQAHKFKIVEANSVLICAEGGSAGRKFAHTNRNIFFGNKLFALTSNNKIDSKFVFYFYQSEEFCSLFRSKMSGLIGGVSINKFKEIEIPLPPIDEQKRIVKILDEVFDSVAKVKETTEKNLKNAREVFESYLQSVFEDGAKKWEKKTLNQVSTNLDSKRIPITKKVRSGGEIPYYGASGIVDYVEDYIFDEDLLLVSEDGANLLARTYPIAFSVSGKCWVNNHAHVLKFEQIESQKFTEYFLNSIRLDPYVSGMAQPKLNQKMLNSIPIPFPSLSEQKQIVTKLDTLSTETKKLEEIYKQKLTHLEELKKSILKKAFNGEL